MKSDLEARSLVDFLCQNHDLDHRQAGRILEEVVSYFDQTPEQFVVQRHRHLQRNGQSNPAIFRQIAEELPTRLFTCSPYSERQIRRIIYG